VEKTEARQIESDELLLRVKACAICGTDIRIWQGKKTKGVRTPSILGHEISGVVESAGEKVTEFSPGDRIVVAPVLPCRRCYYCKNNQENACMNRRGLGYEYDGGFAELMRIPAEYIRSGNVFRFSSNLSYEEACLTEPLGCVFNGSQRSGIKVNDTVVIMGAGPIGIMHLLLAKLKGAANVIVSEPHEHRRKLARELGADLTVDPNRENLTEHVRKQSAGLGANVVVLSVGVSALVDTALSLCRKGGTVNLFGGFPKGEKATLDANLIHYEEIWVTGTTACSRSHFEQSLNLLEQGKLDLKPLISHMFALGDFARALETAKSGKGIKVVITP
jgi:L-iditol 2-dehydrogenase